MATMSDQIRQAIRQCGHSRYEISVKTGVSQGTLSRFLSGENDMTLRLLERIAPLIGAKLVVNAPKRKR